MLHVTKYFHVCVCVRACVWCVRARARACIYCLYISKI